MKRESGGHCVVRGPCTADVACCNHLLAGGDGTEGPDLAFRDVSDDEGEQDGVESGLCKAHLQSPSEA